VVDGPLQVISGIAFPIVTGVYLGVAETAYAEARAAAAHKSDNPFVQQQLGRMRHALQVASWSLDGALDAVGDDPTPSHEAYLAVMIAKAEVARAGIEVCDQAMEVVGGPGYFRGSVVERAYRDIRAARFHPLTADATHVETGRHELGLPGLLQ
jgi:alkylation response protein AidB-like acyl-CoA dehydrogenase